MDALIARARFHFHEQLFETNTLTLTSAGVASNADTSSRGSKAISKKIVDILVDEHHHTVHQVDKISGQTLGKQFELLTMQFLQETFPLSEGILQFCSAIDRIYDASAQIPGCINYSSENLCILLLHTRFFVVSIVPSWHTAN